MTPEPRLTGEPIMRILCKKTDTLVGYLYQWNNGDLQPAWFDGAITDVIYEPFVHAAKGNSANLEIPALHQQGPAHLEKA